MGLMNLFPCISSSAVTWHSPSFPLLHPLEKQPEKIDHEKSLLNQTKQNGHALRGPIEICTSMSPCLEDNFILFSWPDAFSIEFSKSSCKKFKMRGA